LDVCDEGVEDMSGVALRERLSTRGASEHVEEISGVALREGLTPVAERERVPAVTEWRDEREVVGRFLPAADPEGPGARVRHEASQLRTFGREPDQDHN
jgi:hypothetical protein